jgi:hypothetical protein
VIIIFTGMSREEIIRGLTIRLQKEADADVLKAIHILLSDDTEEDRIKRRMNATAILSEQDFKEGRVHSWEEVKAEIDKMLRDLRKKKGAKRA